MRVGLIERDAGYSLAATLGQPESTLVYPGRTVIPLDPQKELISIDCARDSISLLSAPLRCCDPHARLARKCRAESG